MRRVQPRVLRGASDVTLTSMAPRSLADRAARGSGDEQWVTAGIKHRASSERAEPGRAREQAGLRAHLGASMGDGGLGWGYATAPALHREAPENGLCHLVIMANFGGTCRLGN